MPELSSQTIFEQVDAICERILGPTEYSYVAIMNHVADRLSEQGFAVATTDPLMAYALLKASAEIGEAAQMLDQMLVDKMVESFKLEVLQ